MAYWRLGEIEVVELALSERLIGRKAGKEAWELLTQSCINVQCQSGTE